MLESRLLALVSKHKFTFTVAGVERGPTRNILKAFPGICSSRHCQMDSIIGASIS
ncbi:hypothetical protein Mapa_011164 [Marchantia paleacea]|nr:hypothetical protein Mapa_011164 [Marchantia paleacea]